MEQKTAEEIYLDNGCNSKRDIIEAMQSYADQEVSNAIEKALEVVVNNMEWHNCYDSGCHCNTDEHERNILSLKPEILKELEK